MLHTHAHTQRFSATPSSSPQESVVVLKKALQESATAVLLQQLTELTEL